MPQLTVNPKPIARGEAVNNDTKRSVLRVFHVECAIGADPIATPGLPYYGQQLNPSFPGNSDLATLTAPFVRCRGIARMRHINRDTATTFGAGTGSDVYEIAFLFNDEFVQGIDAPANWTFAREEIKIPFLRRLDNVYPNIGTTAPLPNNFGCPGISGGFRVAYRWKLEPFSVFVPFTMTQKTYWVNSQVLTYERLIAIRDQVGKYHEIDDGTEKKLVLRMEPPRIVQEDRRWFRIEYAWMSDPGNSPFSGDENPCKRYLLPTIARGPFQRYRVIPPAQIGYAPTFEVYDTFTRDGTNPFWEPEGYMKLTPAGEVFPL